MAQQVYSTDTTDESYQVQLGIHREMAPVERVNQSMALSCQLKQMAFDAIRRTDPNLSNTECQIRFIQVTYGDRLAEDVRNYLRDRHVE